MHIGCTSGNNILSQRTRNRTQKALTVQMSAMTFTFFACWLPRNVLLLIAPFFPTEFYKKYNQTIGDIMLMSGKKCTRLEVNLSPCIQYVQFIKVGLLKFGLRILTDNTMQVRTSSERSWQRYFSLIRYTIYGQHTHTICSLYSIPILNNLFSGNRIFKCSNSSNIIFMSFKTISEVSMSISLSQRKT